MIDQNRDTNLSFSGDLPEKDLVTYRVSSGYVQQWNSRSVFKKDKNQSPATQTNDLAYNELLREQLPSKFFFTAVVLLFVFCLLGTGGMTFLRSVVSKEQTYSNEANLSNTIKEGMYLPLQEKLVVQYGNYLSQRAKIKMMNLETVDELERAINIAFFELMSTPEFKAGEEPFTSDIVGMLLNFYESENKLAINWNPIQDSLVMPAGSLRGNLKLSGIVPAAAFTKYDLYLTAGREVQITVQGVNPNLTLEDKIKLVYFDIADDIQEERPENVSFPALRNKVFQDGRIMEFSPNPDSVSPIITPEPEKNEVSPDVDILPQVPGVAIPTELPTESVQPSDPANVQTAPTQPAPTQPAPTQPAPVQPAPSQPVQPAPARPARPSRPRPPKPAKPNKPAKPKPAKPSAPAKPAKPSAPAKPSVPVAKPILPAEIPVTPPELPDSGATKPGGKRNTVTIGTANGVPSGKANGVTSGPKTGLTSGKASDAENGLTSGVPSGKANGVTDSDGKAAFSSLGNNTEDENSLAVMGGSGELEPVSETISADIVVPSGSQPIVTPEQQFYPISISTYGDGSFHYPSGPLAGNTEGIAHPNYDERTTLDLGAYRGLIDPFIVLYDENFKVISDNDDYQPLRGSKAFVTYTAQKDQVVSLYIGNVYRQAAQFQIEIKEMR